MVVVVGGGGGFDVRWRLGVGKGEIFTKKEGNEVFYSNVCL